MKKVFQQLHLWLGLISGLLVFVIALTGALYAFNDEISLLAPYRHVNEQNERLLPPSQLQQIAQKAVPGKDLHSIKYNQPNRSAEAIFYGYDPAYYYIVYLNPYNGSVLMVKDMEKDFFRFIMQGHFYLWLAPSVGQPLVAGSTLVFVIVLITGLIIWIPKNRNSLKNRVWFRWKKGTKWPRINLDLHVVGGLYVTVFALIFALTGLVWGFQWFANGVYQLTGGEKSLQYDDVSPIKNASRTPAIAGAQDKVWEYMMRQYPDAASIEVHPPHTDSTLIAANAMAVEGKYSSTDYRYFDQHSLKEVKVNHIYGRATEMNSGENLYRMNYEIHTGAVLGLPGKVFAFLMSLFIASFPVTGCIIWWKKRKKKH